MVKAKLKSCPFCGQMPKVYVDRRYPYWPTDDMVQVDVFEICCVNQKCIIYNANDIYYRTIEDAMEAWNRRDGNDQALQPVQCDGERKVRKWQREIMDRDRDLSRRTGSAADRDGQEL